MKKHIYLLLCIISFLLIVFPMKVYAEEIDTSITLNKDYKEAIFQFIFSDNQSHSITITTPTGDVIEKESDAEEVIMKVTMATSGKYLVKIVAENEIEYDAKVECLNVPVSETTENITVTSQFSNLLFYFSDGNLNVTWANNGIKKVNVEVTNPDTLQKLAKETVEGNKYSLKLAESVKEVEVYLVPSTEARIDGAGVKYTLQVVRDVPGIVYVPSEELTNQEYVPVTVSLEEDNMSVLIYCNGEVVYEEALGKGEYTIKTKLNGVDNDIVVYVLDAKQNRVSYSFSCVKDIVAPSLSLSQVYNGISTKDVDIVLEGIVKNADELLINNESVPFDEKGKFSHTFNLSLGVNSVSFCAVDRAGNETVVLSEIVREEDGTSKLLLIGVAAVVLLIIVLLIAVVMKFSSKKTKEPLEYVPEENKKPEPVKEKAIERKTEKKEKKTQKTEEKRVQSSDVKIEKKISTTSFLQRKKKADKRAFILECGIYLFLLLGVFFIVQKCIMISVIMSESMVGSLNVGDVVFYNRFSYVRNEVERGDIIIYFNESEGKMFTKRVIGIGGDHIEFKNGDVYINNLLVDESAYLSDEIETNCSKVFDVPQGCVFLMGDNRENSFDSRFFLEPYLEEEKIIGKYLGHVGLPSK